ncbi:hypothetical protein [Taibaiella soli]|uniref:Uncharacterized protein n=1 Tax=Taibaiella soli TaxID=1649169 RepID=A0A2W2AZQ4_9BACT|nr:hypothetical protein [Taibaiella soli]PZF73178.1 hypothetical protein DN068_09920 [Taibaiella soli]
MSKITKGRIIITKNIPDNLELAKKIYDKHIIDSSDSLLNNLEDITWNEIGPLIDQCMQLHKKAEELKRQMEEAYRQRDLAYPKISEAIQASKLYLKGRFARNPKKLGEWGFNVDDTPKYKRKTSDV